MIHIGIDLMGSDTPFDVFFDVICHIAKKLSHQITFTLLGTKETKPLFLKKAKPHLANVHFHKVSTSISMHENPLFAIRKKKNSSMFEGLKLLKEKKLDIFLSTGNTGALMTGAKMILPSICPKIRPALLTFMPSKTHPFVVLDIGANIACKTQHFIHFALMGMAFQKAQGIKQPKIGLLNIGTEEKKGTSEIQKAFTTLKHIEQRLNKDFIFLGNVEGREVFERKVDVLVTDGFTGNVFLKTAEGIASFVLDLVKEKIKEEKLYYDLHKHLYYGEHPGALLIGTDAMIIKCHGKSSSLAIKNAIFGSLRLLENNFLTKFKKILTSYIDSWS